MKSYLKSWTFLMLAAFMAPTLLSANRPNYYNGLPGDDFSLEGALELFKSCNSLEDFERELNSPDNTVNNLDLNNNGRIDYLRVVDHDEGDLHAIVIQALIEQGVSQDVAVIEVKRNRYGDAVVQIVGDEDLYGTAKIVEPYPYDDVVGTDYYDDYYRHYSPTVYVNAWAWPTVRFIFAPRYVVWVSPYYYDYYPVWYNPWHPYAYNVWYPRTVVYHHHYCVAPNYRAPEVHHHYYGSRRVSAPVVRQRTETYVKANGGRSNFDYTKGDRRVDNPERRSLDRTDRSSVANRTTDSPREQGTSTTPRGSAGNKDRATQRDAEPRTERPREQGTVSKPRGSNTDASPRTDRPREKSPTAKPQVDQPQTNNLNDDRSRKPEANKPDTRQREVSPAPRPQTSSPSVNNRKEQSRTRQESAPAKPKVDNNRQQSAPKARPETNQQRNAGGRVTTPAKVERQAAPRANSSSSSNRQLNNNSKSAVKNESSQARKGRN